MGFRATFNFQPYREVILAFGMIACCGRKTKLRVKVSTIPYHQRKSSRYRGVVFSGGFTIGKQRNTKFTMSRGTTPKII